MNRSSSCDRSCSIDQRRCKPASSSVPSRPSSRQMSVVASAAAVLLCFCACSSSLLIVSATVCLGANCLQASPYFDEVYSHYQPGEVGYEYTVTLLRFFLSLVCIIVGVWLIRWYMDFRVVWELASAVREERVMRIPAEWASARNSITRDVLAAWMQRQDKPIVPVGVNAIQVPVHTSLAAARLQLAPGTILPPLTLPSSPTSPASPPAGLDYVLKLVLSSSAQRSALVEVYLGVPMKLVVQLISDYEHFATRSREAHGGGAGARKHKKSKRGKHTDVNELASPSAASVQPVFVSRHQSTHPRLTGTGGGGVVEVEMAATITAAGPATPRGGGGFVAHRGRGSNPPPTPIVVDAGLPGSAPSRNNSPSHVTALSESKHLSQLSLREQPARGQSALESRSRPFFEHDHTDGRRSLTPRSPPMTGAAASSASSALSPSPSPSSPPPKGGVALPIGVLNPEEGSHLFMRHEYLHALPPTLFAAGCKQQVSLSFSAALLHETLRDINLCPMLIFLTALDDSVAVPLASPSVAATALPLSPARSNALQAQGKAQASPLSPSPVSVSSPAPRRPLTGELTIVQFAPAPASSHPSAAAAAAAAKQAAALSLPALAITTSDAAELAATAAAGDGEEKEAKDDDEEEKKSEVQSPTAATSPGAAAAQDAYTSRAKFERQLVITDDAVYEMEVRPRTSTARDSGTACVLCSPFCLCSFALLSLLLLPLLFRSCTVWTRVTPSASSV